MNIFGSERTFCAGLIKTLKIEGSSLSTLFYSILQGSKTLKIWPKNGRVLAVLVHILIKPPQMNTFASEEYFRDGLILKRLKIKGNRLLFRGAIKAGRIK